MPEFVIETYLPRDAPDVAALGAGDAALAAEQAREEGAQIRFLGAIFVPEDETCFYLYQSPSAEAVRDAATRARLRFERITQAVSITPHRSATDPAGLSHRTHRP